MIIYGELYTFEIETFAFDINPKIPNIVDAHFVANSDEDFSIFELGPVIVNNITFLANNCTIGSENYGKVCINVLQNPGRWIQVTFRRLRSNPEDPIDSGEVITVIKDYVIKID